MIGFFERYKKTIISGAICLCLLCLSFLLIHSSETSRKEKLGKAILVWSMQSKREVMEWAYKEGQQDALEGDVRIEQLDDSTWKWTKSAWDVCGNDLDCIPEIFTKEYLENHWDNRDK